MSRLDAWLDATVVLSFTRLGYFLRKKHLPEVTTPMTGKVVVVTGGTSGLGEAAARKLALLGARVCIVGRSLQKLSEVQKRLPPSVEVERCDLSSLRDIRQLATRLLERYPHIHVLINNAGVLPKERVETDEGHEVCFATNLLGHFLLTELLLPRLKESAPSRIVNVSSGGMYTQKIHPDDLQFKNQRYQGAVAYARTKRGQVILTEEWAQQLKASSVVVNAMHPGWADTQGVKTQLPTFYKLTKPFLRTPDEGADTVVWLSASKEAEQVTGKFFLDRIARDTHRLSSTKETPAERQRFLAELKKWAFSVPSV